MEEQLVFYACVNSFTHIPEEDLGITGQSNIDFSNPFKES